MLDESTVQGLLRPFELDLDKTQIRQILLYLDLLLRWNKMINLTSIKSPEECITRHFGESLYLARWAKLHGSLLDVGSGAGFPGLVLRIAFPSLRITLLEPIAKKRAFLKEAARACGMGSIEVRPDRLEDFTPVGAGHGFDILTARAVGDHRTLVRDAAEVLRPEGIVCLWLGHEQGLALAGYSTRVQWGEPIRIPLTREREIWVGRLIPE